MERIVIAGGGLAAQRGAEALRARGYDGRIVMVCAEPVRPYDRPPLSKEALTAAVDCFLRPESWYPDNDVELLLGDPVRTLAEAARAAGGSGARLAAAAAPARPRELHPTRRRIAGVWEACPAEREISPTRRRIAGVWDVFPGGSPPPRRARRLRSP